MKNVKKYDVAIIGAGPGGMTAALYASRANLSVIMIDGGIYGGQMNNTAGIGNYTGFKKVLGPKLSKYMFQSCTQYGAKYAYGKVKSITNRNNHVKIIHTNMGTYQAKVVIIATGSNCRKLGIPGENKYAGRGVSYCAVCDGNFFKNAKVIVVGGGDSAVSEALYLSHLAQIVTIIHRHSKLDAQQLLQQKAFDNPKINFIWNSNVIRVNGNGKEVTSINIKNSKNNEVKNINDSGIFIYIGQVPNTKPFVKLGITDENGWIKTDSEMRTSVKGIFAIGDVREKHLRQIATAVGEGGIAGQNAYNYIENL